MGGDPTRPDQVVMRAATGTPQSKPNLNHHPGFAKEEGKVEEDPPPIPLFRARRLGPAIGHPPEAEEKEEEEEHDRENLLLKQSCQKLAKDMQERFQVFLKSC